MPEMLHPHRRHVAIAEVAAWQDYPSLPILGVIVVLATVLAGCAAARTSLRQDTPVADMVTEVETNGPGLPLTTSVPVPRADTRQETLQEFVARTVAPDIAVGARSYLVADTVVEDKDNLYRGASTSRDAIRQCWLYRAGTSHPCTLDHIEQAFFVQARHEPLPRMLFAIAYTQADKVLVILDYYHHREQKDRIDGYRIVLTRDHSTWHEASREQVY